MSEVERLAGIAANSNESSYKRRNAVVDLSEHVDVKSIETLSGLLEDDDSYFRKEIISSLKKSDCRSACPS